MSSSEQMEPCGHRHVGCAAGAGPHRPALSLLRGQDEGFGAAMWLGAGVPHASAENQASLQSPSRQQSPWADPRPLASLPRPYGTSCRVVGRQPKPQADAGVRLAAVLRSQNWVLSWQSLPELVSEVLHLLGCFAVDRQAVPVCLSNIQQPP